MVATCATFTLLSLCISLALFYIFLSAGWHISYFIWPDTYPVILTKGITRFLGFSAMVTLPFVVITPAVISLSSLKLFWNGITLTAVKSLVKIFFALTSISVFSAFFMALIRITA